MSKPVDKNALPPPAMPATTRNLRVLMELGVASRVEQAKEKFARDLDIAVSRDPAVKESRENAAQAHCKAARAFLKLPVPDVAEAKKYFEKAAAHNPTACPKPEGM